MIWELFIPEWWAENYKQLGHTVVFYWGYGGTGYNTDMEIVWTHLLQIVSDYLRGENSLTANYNKNVILLNTPKPDWSVKSFKVP